jgi:hypothetical protein
MNDFSGIGGSYIVDPKTGEIKLVERTKDAATGQTPLQPAAPAPAKKPDAIKE